VNKDIFERRWKLVRGEVRGWWSRFSEADLDKVNGRFEVFLVLLREKYGYSRARAVKAIDQHVGEFDAQRKKRILPL
jgi:glutathione S-transferase